MNKILPFYRLWVFSFFAKYLYEKLPHSKKKKNSQTNFFDQKKEN